MNLISPNNDEGYPGKVTARVTFQLTDDGELHIDMTAESPEKATPINLTNHSYFNLAGHVRSTFISPLMREVKYSSPNKIHCISSLFNERLEQDKDGTNTENLKYFYVKNFLWKNFYTEEL